MYLAELIKNRLHQAINCDHAVVLTYHSVIKKPLDFNIWTHMPLELFEEHMDIISKNSNVIPLSHLIERIKSNDVHGNLVSVTFDDGFRNNFSNAYPVLQKYNVPATIFLTTDYIGTDNLLWPERVSYQLLRTKKKIVSTKRFGDFSLQSPELKAIAYRTIVNELKKLPSHELLTQVAKMENQIGAAHSPFDSLFQELMLLSWEEVGSMAEGGLVSFGGHTATHAILSQLENDEIYTEIKNCRKALDDHFSDKITLWAYPNGMRNDYTPESQVQLCKNGFDGGIMTMESEFISCNSDTHELGRFGIGSNMNIKDLQTLLYKRNRIGQYEGVVKLQQIAKGLISCIGMKH